VLIWMSLFCAGVVMLGVGLGYKLGFRRGQLALIDTMRKFQQANDDWLALAGYSEEPDEPGGGE